MKYLILSAIIITTSNAFAKHSDILLKYELDQQLQWGESKERSPNSEDTEKNDFSQLENETPPAEQEQNDE